MRRFAPRLVSIHSHQRSWALRLLVGAAIVVLLAAGLTAPQWISTSQKAAATSTPTVTDFTRPDRATAFALATATSHRVEVTGERTETSTVWANPDGSVTVDATQAPIRVHKADGSWSPVDVSLHQNADATWSPSSVVNQFTISNGGGTAGTWQPLVTTVDSAANRIGWLWQGALPTPTIAGATATFQAVVPGVDLVVSATPVGFEQSFVLTARPDGPVALPLAIASGSGLTLNEGADGAYRLVDSAGATVADASVATAWDASQAPAPTDQPQQIAVPTDASVAPADVVAPGQTGTAVSLDQAAYNAAATGGSATPSASSTPTPSASGPAASTVDTTLPTTNADVSAVLANAPAKDHTLVIAPDAGMLADPATVYPVTIDPAVNLTPTWDSYVNSGAATSHYETATSLYVGQGGGGQTFRSYLTFDFTSLYKAIPSSAQVQSAQLKMYEMSASSCTATPWEMRQSTTPPTQVTWTTIPTPLASTIAATTTSAKGLAGCPTDWSSMDITNWIKALVGAGAPSKPAVVLKGQTETGSNKVHQFASSEYSVYDPINMVYHYYPPTMSVTYDNYPDAPTALGLSGGGTAGSTYWAHSISPTATVKVSDKDGGKVSALFQVFPTGSTTPITKTPIVGSSVVSGGTSTAVIDPALFTTPMVNGGSYQIQAVANDGTLTSSAAASRTFSIDTAAPVVGTATCSSHPQGAWNYTYLPPDTDYCSIAASDPGTVTSGVSAMWWSLDDPTPNTQAAFSGSSVGLYLPQLSIGWHTLYFQAQDAAGNLSAVVPYSFGYGTGGFTNMPTGQSSSSAVNVTSSFSRGSTVTYKYYDTTTSTWKPIAANALLLADGTNPASNAVPLTAAGNNYASPPLSWAISSTLTNASIVKIQACNDYSTPDCSPISQIVFDPQGTSGASVPVGPASVSLATGNMSLSASDVSIQAARDTLSVSRSYNSLNALTSGSNGLFGPGWSSSIAAVGSLRDARLVDTGTDVIIYDETNTPSAFTWDGSTYQATSSTLGEILTKAGSGSSTTFTVTEQDKVTKTVYAFEAASSTFQSSPTATTPNVYAVANYSAPGLGKTVTQYDSNGYPTRIVASLPNTSTDVTSTAGCPATQATGAPTGGTWAEGCRALHFVYDTNHHITSIVYDYGTTTGTSVSQDVACYSYNPFLNNTLFMQWDPRDRLNSPGTPTCVNTDPSINNPPVPIVHTSYIQVPINGNYVMSSVQTTGPAGSNGQQLASWVFHYDGTHRLSSVTRDHSSGGTETTSISYGVKFDGSTDSGQTVAYPDLRTAAVKTWAQQTAPITAVEVFGPTGTSADIRTGTIYALDAQGRTLNTATYDGQGPSKWAITTTEYDQFGNSVRSLSAGNRDLALASSTDPTLKDLGLDGMSTDQRAVRLDTETTYSSDGLDAISVLGPAHRITDIGQPSQIVRDHSTTVYGLVDYSTQVPTDWVAQAPIHQQSKSISAEQVLGTTTDIDSQETDYAYTLIAAPTLDADKAGWKYNTPLRTTTGVGSGSVIVHETILDPDTGQILQQRQPSEAGTGNGPGTHVTTYYSAPATGASDDPANCKSLQWFGQVCIVGPAHQQSSGPQLASTVYPAYDAFLRPTEVDEQIPSAPTRVSTTTYDDNGVGNNAVSSQTTGGLGTAFPATTTTYDPTTGAVASVSTTDTSNVTTTVSNTYDDFGRVITSTDARGATTTTTYNNTTGQVVQSVATMPTASGTATVASTAYTYGSATDPRALLTGTTSTDLGQTISGTYNADGALVTESLPLANGQSGDTLTQAWTIDPAGQTTTLKTTESVGGNIWQNDQRTFDGHGQVSTETSNITGYAARTYGYDAFGRLTGVADGPVNACQTRTYSYDVNGNRTASATYGPDATGACGLTGAGTPTRTVSTTFDATDTATSTTVNGVTSNPNYDYYGRVTSLPAAASPNALAATVGYYNSDLVKSITTTDPVTSATLTQSITYDPSSRMLADTNSGSSTTTTAYYYADASSASPAWTATIPAGQTYPTSITRQIDGLNGNTIASWTGPLGGTGTSKLDLVNLHGDIVCTANPSDIASPSDPVQVIDEFGQTLTGSQKTYGWVGGKDKVTDTTTGLVFMGARLYDSLLGQFIQRDPVYGGNDNAYGYPQDPVLGYDLSGQWGIHIHWRNLLGLSSRNDSWAIGQFFALAVRLTGGKCGSEGGLRVCYGGWHLFANGGTTWGDTFVTSRKQRQDYIDAKWWPGILRHEKRHRDLQWRRFGGYFGPMYLWAQGLSWLTGKPNVFEKQAGLCDGHYTTVCHHGK